MLQLVDEGLFDLDRPLHEYLPKPIPEYDDYGDLAGDDRWRALTARHVLNHATGFANFRWLEDDRKLRFHFAPGERYAYSGEGFYLLQVTLVVVRKAGRTETSPTSRRFRFAQGFERVRRPWQNDAPGNSDVPPRVGPGDG